MIIPFSEEILTGKRESALVYVTSPLRSQRVNERNRLWLLKNSLFVPDSKNWGMENA
jgi:hypothetical protein